MLTWMERGMEYSRSSPLSGLAGLEELDDARQTAGDVLGTGGLTRDLGENVARGDFVTVGDHKVSA